MTDQEMPPCPYCGSESRDVVVDGSRVYRLECNVCFSCGPPAVGRNALQGEAGAIDAARTAKPFAALTTWIKKELQAQAAEAAIRSPSLATVAHRRGAAEMATKVLGWCERFKVKKGRRTA
jgi:hypothetical protein